MTTTNKKRLPRNWWNCFLSSRHRFPRHLQCPTFWDILASIDSKKLRTQMHLWKDAGVQLHAMLPGKIIRYHKDIMKYTSLDPWTSEIVAICCNDITMTHLAYVNVSSWSFWILFDSLCVFVASTFSPPKNINTQGPPPKNMHGSWASRRCELAIRLFVHHSEGIKSHFTLNWHLLRQIATGSTQQTILLFPVLSKSRSVNLNEVTMHCLYMVDSVALGKICHNISFLKSIVWYCFFAVLCTKADGLSIGLLPVNSIDLSWHPMEGQFMKCFFQPSHSQWNWKSDGQKIRPLWPDHFVRREVSHGQETRGPFPFPLGKSWLFNRDPYVMVLFKFPYNIWVVFHPQQIP